jgi:N-acetylmuramoyl-L-alanine amidase
LIECGFLSNPTEEALLQTDAYRLKIAAVLAAGFLRSRAALRDVIFSG